MPAVRLSGMVSGLPPNIVDQIMEAEKIPIKQMQSKKAVDEDKLKLVNEIEGKVQEITKSLGELTSTRGFQNNKLISGDPNIISGVVDPEKSVSGTWQVEVMQLAEKPGALTNGFPDKDRTQLGVGYLKFETQEGTKEVYINGTSNTLEGAANAINASGTGLRATILNDRADKETPYRLLITGMSSGNDNEVKFPTIYMLDGDQDVFFEKSKKAQNAKVKIDGFETEISDNSLKDIIPGCNLELKQAAPGRAITVTIKEDYEVISGKIKSFVDAYNGALGWIQNQHKISKDKEGRQRLGPLGGDGMLRTIENALRRTIQAPQNGGDDPAHRVERLSDLGIEFNRNGTLNFNQEKFNKRLTTDPTSVAKFFRGDGFKTGFVPSVQREVNNIVNGSFGPLAVRKRGIDERIKSADERIARKESQLEKKEDSLRTKFSNLESQMSKIQSQGAALGGIQQGGGGR